MKLVITGGNPTVGVGFTAIQLLSAGATRTRLISRGIVGPAGPVGPGAAFYEHVQASPAVQWIVNHNFGYKPVVEVLSVGGMVVFADVVHMSLNQVIINFNTPQVGTVTVR